jgi:DNA-directed RNA polymerase specialized sigma24 family protein
MTDSPQNNSKSRRTLSPESFAQFLGFLSPDTDEAGRLYTRLHQKLTGFFSLKGISDPVNAADETIDRAAVKIATGATVPDVNKYCSGIARNIAKERFRRAQREDSTFQRFVENLASYSDEEVERIERILKPCFEELTPEDQSLLLDYCQVMRGRARAEHRRKLAEKLESTVLALRMRVTRLRSILAECVKKHSHAM